MKGASLALEVELVLEVGLGELVATTVDGVGNSVEITDCEGDTDDVVDVNWVVEFDTMIVEVKKVVRSEMVVREKLKDESVV